MHALEQISRDRRSAWYRLLDPHEGSLGRWVVSTPKTQAICNHPELIGVEFSRGLRDGISHALASAPFAETFRSIDETRVCVMNFLRGSLNFGLREAVADAWNFNRHGTCFMSSQRYRQDGRWFVREDMYRKMSIPDQALLMVGDVVATGVTLENGLEVIADHLEAQKIRLSGLVFFTIGCHKLEKVLQKFDDRFRKGNPDYLGTHVVYLEGKFRLVDSGTNLKIAIHGTDLIHRDAIISPEYELSLYRNLAPVLERCAIYDAGSRSFDVLEYLDDVLHYWQQVRRLARRGTTLREAMRERWPEQGYDDPASLRARKQESWQKVPDETIDELVQAYEARWTPEFSAWCRTSDALESLASERLELLEGLRGPRKEDK